MNHGSNADNAASSLEAKSLPRWHSHSSVSATEMQKNTWTLKIGGKDPPTGGLHQRLKGNIAQGVQVSHTYPLNRSYLKKRIESFNALIIYFVFKKVLPFPFSVDRAVFISASLAVGLDTCARTVHATDGHWGSCSTVC